MINLTNQLFFSIKVKTLWLSNMLRILHNLKQYSGEKQFQVCIIFKTWCYTTEQRWLPPPISAMLSTSQSLC